MKKAAATKAPRKKTTKRPASVLKARQSRAKTAKRPSRLTALLRNKWAVVAAFVVVFGGAGSLLMNTSHADQAPDTPQSYPNNARVTINGNEYRAASPGQPWSNLIGNGYDSFELQTGDQFVTDGHPAAAKSELASSTHTAYNNDVWLSFALYVPSSSRLPTQSWAIAGQMHSDEDDDECATQPPFAQEFDSGVFHVLTRSNTAANDNCQNVPGVVRYEDKNFPRDTWVNFVYHMKFSRAGGGFLQAWRDGQEIIPASHIPLGYNDVLAPYWRFGTYRYKPSPGTTIFDYANMEMTIGAKANLQDRVANPLPVVVPPGVTQ